MAGKTKIGGTAYTIKGGKTKIGGTAYSIKQGKTLIGGTSKSITFSSMPSGCIAEYLFNNSWDDTSGSEYNLTNNNASIVSSGLSELPYCAYFTGSSSCYAYSNNGVLPLRNPLSVSIWLKVSSSSGTHFAINTARSSDNCYGYYINCYNNYFEFCSQNGGSAGSGWLSLSVNTSLADWSHMVVAIEGGTDGGAYLLYKNGSLLASTTLPLSCQPTVNSTNLYLGARDNGSFPYAGYIAGLRVYNKVLSASEVLTLYNSGNGI